MAKKITGDRKSYRIYTDENDLRKYFTVMCSNARKAVTLLRSDHDVLTARRGSTIACMDANCAVRHKDAFPHPVYLVAFTKKSCYVVDRIDKGGVPLHAVVYEHYQKRDIDIHDRIGPQELLRRGRANKTIRLFPPRPRLPGRGSGVTSGVHRPAEQRRISTLPRGAKERARNAGIAEIVLA